MLAPPTAGAQRAACSALPTTGQATARPRAPERPGRAAAAEAASLSTAEAPGTSGQAKGFAFTSYEANAWRGEFRRSGVTVLVDPWLVGELTFGPTRWAYRGLKKIRPDLDAVLAGVDFLLITQGLPDHAHEPTLRALPKSLPVVCAASATGMLRGLGFRDVSELDHGQTLRVAQDRLQLRATQGALTGPPWDKRQNGFFLQERGEGGLLLYYEPHCDYVPESLEPQPGPVDVVITPVVNQQLGTASLGYPLVMGDQNLEGLLRQLQPRVLIPLENAGFEQQGPLSKAIAQKRSSHDTRERLRQAGLPDVRVQEVEGPGKLLAVDF